MRNFIKIFPHVLIWTIVLIVPTYLMSREGVFDSKPFYNYCIRISLLAILFYFNYLYLIEKFLFNRKIITYISINIVLVIIIVALQTTISDLLAFSIPVNMQEHPKDFPRMEDHRRGGPGGPPLMKFVIDYMSIFFLIGLSVAIKMTARWYKDSITFEKIKSVQLEADLRNLRSQLNPHFLFNTLNNIYSLIAIDQNGAQDAIHRLSNLLRYVMYDNDQKFVPLDKELEFTKNYIDLMRLRLSSMVKLNVEINSAESKDLIASLMFITLIENAFKHGINNGENSFINISILVDAGKGVLCTVENSLIEKAENMETHNSGIGLVNLTKRLELLYPDRYEFIAERRPDRFFTLLKIDFKKIEITA